MDKKAITKIEELKEYLKKIEYLGSCISLLHWDSVVYMPKDAIEYRSEMIGYLTGESYKLTTSEKMKEFIDYFSGISDLDDLTKAILENITKEYDRATKIPEAEYVQYEIDKALSQSTWEEAKKKSDFSIFKPHLAKMIAYNKKFSEYWGFADNKYNGLLDIYEPGMTTERLDAVFGELRESLVDLLQRIRNSNVKTDDAFIKGNYSVESQRKLGEIILAQLGYDYETRGRIDVSEHPFTTNFGNKDVRITTKYDPTDFRPAIFSMIHEGGHGIYEQNIPDKLLGTSLGSGASMGMHESQSRFYENTLGKSMEFWSFFYPRFQEAYQELEGVDLISFYKTVNCVEPSLIRIDADELTYSLHIIIRYEMEKLLINSDVDIDDIPRLWNEKYKEYLGVEPENDADGILQDVHWSGGDFGYFPSYALGNLYGAQIFNKLKEEIPDWRQKITNGGFSSITKWLKENVHQYGATIKPAELIQKVTGEELNAKYFTGYLNDKFGKLYGLL
jgi:carboxypeptidase Taq